LRSEAVMTVLMVFRTPLALVMLIKMTASEEAQRRQFRRVKAIQ
jgi:hypothetical protein